MSFRKLYDAVTEKCVSGGKFGLGWLTDEESDYSGETEVGGTQMTTETVNFNRHEIKVPETDNGSNYCSHNNFGSVRMTTNLEDQSIRHKTNLPNNDETSMKNTPGEGREAAREHQAQDSAFKLDFQWDNAHKNGTQTATSHSKFNV